MPGIIDADTHISESEAMWSMMDKEMYHRRPVMMKCPEDTLYGPRNAFWLIDGNVFPKPNGKGSFRLITPSASKLESARGDIAIGCPGNDRHLQPPQRHGQASSRYAGGLSDLIFDLYHR